MEKVLMLLILSMMCVAIIVGPFVAGAWAERRDNRPPTKFVFRKGVRTLPFIQVTALILTKDSQTPRTPRDLWLNVEDIHAFQTIIPDEHPSRANCYIDAVRDNWYIEETADKLALLIEEAEAKSGQQVLAAALQEHARALRAKWC